MDKQRQETMSVLNEAVRNLMSYWFCVPSMWFAEFPQEDHEDGGAPATDPERREGRPG